MFKDRRGPKPNCFLQEITENQDNRPLIARDKFRVDTFTVIWDSISAEIERRDQTYTIFNERFQVVFHLRWLSSSGKIRNLAANLQKAYTLDLEEDFPDEMVRFSGHLKQMDENVFTPVGLTAFANIQWHTDMG